jgi:hypothetical protein
MEQLCSATVEEKSHRLSGKNGMISGSAVFFKNP